MKVRKMSKLKATLLVETAILIALGIVLADLVAQDIANKYYPVPEMPEIELPEEQKTIAEHICLATNGENCQVLVNLARCESSLNDQAYHVNNNKSVDLGLFQINSVHYGKSITPSCALDVYCSARWSNDQIKKGNGHIWVCWDKI